MTSTPANTATTDYPALATSSQDPQDAQLVIREVLPGIVTFSKPFTRHGFMPIGGRTTAVSLPNNEVFVYVSTPLSQATKSALEKLGDVRYLVTPDGEHDMYIEEYAKAYPTAKTIGVKRLKQARPNVAWTGLYGLGGESIQYGFEPHISLHNVSTHINDELVAIHHPTGTLIEADILFNLTATEQYSRAGGLGWLNGSSLNPDGWFHQKAAGALIKDKKLFKTELQSINNAKWDRIIPCHGEIINSGGRAAWDKLWAKYA